MERNTISIIILIEIHDSSYIKLKVKIIMNDDPSGINRRKWKLLEDLLVMREDIGRLLSSFIRCRSWQDGIDLSTRGIIEGWIARGLDNEHLVPMFPIIVISKLIT